MCYEDFVNTILLDKGINSIEHLNIECLAAAFNINIYYWNCKTFLLSDEDVSIVIDNKKNEIQQYEEFLHELGHYILYKNHIKLITDLGDWKYIEGKVNHLVPYIAIPKFLIDNVCHLQTVEAVSNLFYVPHDIARKRLEGIKNRILSLRGDVYASIQRQENREMVLSN